MSEPRKIHEALSALGIEYAALSWGGFNLFGDQKSVTEASRLLHMEGTVQALQAEVVRLRAEVDRLRFNGREAIVAWMDEMSYATGHGDTIEDLLVELEGQAIDRGVLHSGGG
jgi:hypothetical protein